MWQNIKEPNVVQAWFVYNSMEEVIKCFSSLRLHWLIFINFWNRNTGIFYKTCSSFIFITLKLMWEFWHKMSKYPYDQSSIVVVCLLEMPWRTQRLHGLYVAVQRFVNELFVGQNYQKRLGEWNELQVCFCGLNCPIFFIRLGELQV